MVRELSKHQCCFLFDCCICYCKVRIVELLLLSENKDTTGKIVSHTNQSPTDVFSGHYDNELFLLQKEIDAPHDNLNHHDIHACEEQDQDVILTHATILSHTFALPQFMDHVKTRILLTLQAQYQPLSKSPGITPCMLSVLITQWKSSATGTLALITT